MTHHNHEHQKWHPAEELNGRLAMIGVVAALLNYAWTGQIIPGIWSVSYTHLTLPTIYSV